MQHRLHVQRKFYIILILEGHNWETEVGLIFGAMYRYYMLEQKELTCGSCCHPSSA